ncbi:MAG: amidohydrolase family protein [Candidatus Brocadia sp.]|jgi:cytosine/adenosine deaminase-related metal-dependent hydrolase
MLIIKSKYIIPEPDTCIKDAAVAIKGTKIHCIGTFGEIKALADIDKIIDLGNAVILPGLINVHTHLDLTNLHNCIKPTSNFTHWIFQLLGARIRWKEGDYTSSIETGIKLCIEAGTTTVADIANTEYSFSVLKKSPLRKVVYKEIIDLNPDHAKDVITKIRSELSEHDYNKLMSRNFKYPPVSPRKRGDNEGGSYRSPDLTSRNFKAEILRSFHSLRMTNNTKKCHSERSEESNLFRIGLSPHAPYSVSKELYQAIAQYARETNIPVCTHTAETLDEIEFLTKGTGSFPTFLRQLRAIPASWQPPGLTPIHYLKGTGMLDNRPLLIHCNYITDEEISLIKSSGASVAFCPRSHRFFGHTNHSVQKLLDAGVNVGLGTDSLASNDSLSILDEMKFLFLHYAISPETILSMATVNGAKALGLGSHVGQIREGFEADLCGIRLSNTHPQDVHSQLLDADSKNIFTMVSGVICYQASSIQMY